MSCSWRQLAVHTQLLTHRADRKVCRKATCCMGYRLRCVLCPGIRLLSHIRLLIPTIKERRPSPSRQLLSWQCFENLPRCISVCFEFLVLLNQGPSGSGGMVPVASSEDSSTTTSSSTVSPWSDSNSKDPKSMVPNVTFAMFLALLHRKNTFSFGCRFRGSSVKVSLCSAICSNMTNTPTAKTFFVGSACPPPVVLPLVESFRGLVWSKAASATVDDCHDARPHLCVVKKQCCCAVYSISRSVGHMERRVASRMSLGNWSPVRSRCLRSMRLHKERPELHSISFFRSFVMSSAVPLHCSVPYV